MSKRILITGGTGSLGTALVERLLTGDAFDEIGVLARNESNLTYMKLKYPDVRVISGDVRNLERLRDVFPGFTHIIHAAAMKHVIRCEEAVFETVDTNVRGSYNVCRAAAESGVERVTAVSTDKAPIPETGYGASKLLMERMVLESDAGPSDTEFNAVRYGNVLKSAQSVLLLWEKQINQGQPVTLTDPFMTRFWISMPQAVDLVLNQLLYGDRGCIRVPKLKSTTMRFLAETVTPKGHDIVEIGRRSGEKLHETMLFAGEGLYTENYKDYYQVYSPLRKLSDPLSESLEYRSDNCGFYTRRELIPMLNSYNPYGGRIYE